MLLISMSGTQRLRVAHSEAPDSSAPNTNSTRRRISYLRRYLLPPLSHTSTPQHAVGALTGFAAGA